MSAGRLHTFVGAASIYGPTYNALSDVYPCARFDWTFADEVKWVVSVESVVGTPTAWTLDVVFEYAVPNTTSGRNEYPRWFALDEATLSADVPAGPFSQFSDTSPLPQAQARTIRNFGANMRIRLIPSFTGGTNPGLRITVAAESRGA